MSEQEGRVIGMLPIPGTLVPPFTKIQMLVGRPIQTQVATNLTAEQVEARRQRWLEFSTWPAYYQLQGSSWYFTTTIQQLAAIDARLLLDDVRASKLDASGGSKSPHDTTDDFQAYALASMWVMAGFQLIYTMEQAVDDHPNMDGVKGKIKSVKRDFLRLRSPLAKRKKEDGAYPYPYSAARVDGSVCWTLSSKGDVISRLGLSDRLLNLVEFVARHVGPHKKWPPDSP